MTEDIRDIRYRLMDLSNELNLYIEEYKGQRFINDLELAKNKIDESIQCLIDWQHNFFRV